MQNGLHPLWQCLSVTDGTVRIHTYVVTIGPLWIRSLTLTDIHSHTQMIWWPSGLGTETLQTRLIGCKPRNNANHWSQLDHLFVCLVLSFSVFMSGPLNHANHRHYMSYTWQIKQIVVSAVLYQCLPRMAGKPHSCSLMRYSSLISSSTHSTWCRWTSCSIQISPEGILRSESCKTVVPIASLHIQTNPQEQYKYIHWHFTTHIV